jgi:hypothetical protein
MHRFRAWGLSAALAAGAGAPAIAADPPTDPRPAVNRPTTLYAKLFGPKPAAPGSAAAMRTPAAPVPLAPEALGDALRQEQEAYLRRVSVCCELRRVGAERNDDALVRQADEIERQAAALYNQRVAALGVPNVKAPLPEASPASVLDRKLGTGIAVNPLTAPAAPTPLDGGGIRTAEARIPAPAGITAPTPQTAPVREVKP